MNTRDSDDDKPNPDKIVDRKTAQQELRKTHIGKAPDFVLIRPRRKTEAEWQDIIRQEKYRLRKVDDA